MELTDYARVLAKRWPTALIVALATFALTAAISLNMTPHYTATTSVFFATQAGGSVSELAQGSTFTERQMSSYAEVARSPLVLDPVIDALDLSVTSRQLASMLSVSVPPETVVLEISAASESPELSARIANAVAAELSTAAATLTPGASGEAESVRATIMTPALPPATPSAPNTPRNLLVGLVLGTLLGIAVASLRDRLDTKVRTETDLAAVTDVSVIGTIGYDENASAHPIVMHDDPQGQRAEAYRRLRTNLQFLDLADRPSSVVVTSSVSGEGKSTTAVNLAVSLSDAGSQVVLVDADLRRPSIAEYTGLEGRVGLTTVLIGKASLDDVLQPWGSSTLDVLTSGQVPPNPSELLGSRAMNALLRDLTDRYDVVILDSPPLLPVTDAAVLSSGVGGMLVVVGADRIHKGQLRDSLESLATVNAHLLGLVINKVSRQDGDRYGYSYDSYRSVETGDRNRHARRNQRSERAGR
ncbi:polysaccharide biosynthesis tyrosine autokinase [Georgenia wangjunii]|uniref:polysaccharide biosynthesis tyrosine autokinase n=1 Tax=Georgenia wangjunii TaxID=3117730 RepID=UPI002F26369B